MYKISLISSSNLKELLITTCYHVSLKYLTYLIRPHDILQGEHFIPIVEMTAPVPC